MAREADGTDPTESNTPPSSDTHTSPDGGALSGGPRLLRSARVPGATNASP